MTFIQTESLEELINGKLKNRNHNDIEVLRLLVLLKQAKENNRYVLQYEV